MNTLNKLDLKSLSKFLSYILRHNPESIGLELDNSGWAKVSELIAKTEQNGKPVDLATIEQIMRQSNKQRFIFSEDKKYIRASYGHSIGVELELDPKDPPEVLYHGTAQNNVKSILKDGIRPGNRDFVHLSAKRKDAQMVGSRHGTPVILTIKATEMSRRGYDFYQSESEPDIWLTHKVPAEFLISE